MLPWTIVLLLSVVVFLLLRKIAKHKEIHKQQGLFKAWPIKKVSVDELDPIFTPNQFGPTRDAMVHFLGASNLVVPGGTSDSESWILSVLAKKSKNIFEFGTCTGKTTYLMAINAPEDASVTTLTLAPDQLGMYSKEKTDSTISTNDALVESGFTSFLYSDTAEERKITQLFMDSKMLNETTYANKMDLIFIDGSHAYSYVMSDTKKALKMLAPGGILLWHDYRGRHRTADVFRALNFLAKELPLRHIKGTSLVAYRKPQSL